MNASKVAHWGWQVIPRHPFSSTTLLDRFALKCVYPCFCNTAWWWHTGKDVVIPGKWRQKKKKNTWITFKAKGTRNRWKKARQKKKKKNSNKVSLCWGILSRSSWLHCAHSLHPLSQWFSVGRDSAPLSSKDAQQCLGTGEWGRVLRAWSGNT